MKQKIIGKYEAGFGLVQLVVEEGSDGSFWFLPGDIDIPRIKIGIEADWVHVIEVLLHEVGEYAAARLGLRYSGADEIGRDIHAYQFFMTHPQFSEMQAITADFLVNCYDDLHKAWMKWNKIKKDV